MITLCAVFRSVLQHLTVYHCLRLVVQVVSEKPLLRMQFLLAELVDFSDCAHDSILVLVAPVLTELLEENEEVR